MFVVVLTPVQIAAAAVLFMLKNTIIMVVLQYVMQKMHLTSPLAEAEDDIICFVFFGHCVCSLTVRKEATLIQNTTEEVGSIGRIKNLIRAGVPAWIRWKQWLVDVIVMTLVEIAVEAVLSVHKDFIRRHPPVIRCIILHMSE